MADAILYPGAVTVRAYSALCSIVGTTPWGDSNDSTYGRVDGSADGSQLGTLQAPVPQTGFVPSSCTDVHLYVRASANSTTASGQGVQVTVWDDSVGSRIGSVGVASHLLDGTFTTDGTLVADGTIHDYLFRWSDVDSGGNHSFELVNINDGTPTWDPPTFAAWVQNHSTNLAVSLFQPGAITYYELWIVLVGASGTSDCYVDAPIVNVRGCTGGVLQAPTLVGNPDTMWGDADDATYGQTNDSDTGMGVGQIYGDVQPRSDTLAAISAAVSMRASISAGTRMSLGINALGDDDHVGWTVGYICPAGSTGGWINFSTTGSIVEFDGMILYDGSTGEQFTSTAMRSLLASGFTVQAQTDGNPQTLMVTEVTLRIYVPCTQTGAPQSYRVPLRLWPRSDLRHWPPPASRWGSSRRVGGYD